MKHHQGYLLKELLVQANNAEEFEVMMNMGGLFMGADDGCRLLLSCRVPVGVFLNDFVNLRSSALKLAIPCRATSRVGTVGTCAPKHSPGHHRYGQKLVPSELNSILVHGHSHTCRIARSSSGTVDSHRIGLCLRACTCCQRHCGHRACATTRDREWVWTKRYLRLWR